MFTTNGWEHDVVHGAVGSFDRRFGDAKQQAGLAGHAAKVGQKLLLDTTLRRGVDALDRLDERLDQVVGQLGRAVGGPGGKQGRPHRLRMPPQLVWLFHLHALAVRLSNFGWHLRE
jgi:hypothetical protein